jgi:hypothetical protein
MIKPQDIPEIPQSEIVSLVREGKQHPYYGQVVDRARVMKAWYNAQERIWENVPNNKSLIVRKSPIESDTDYANRLLNFDLLPLENKFIQTQQRIYDENNVQRTYPEGSEEFWEAKEEMYDDCGDDINVFYRDKVLFTKEVEGFGAICLDIAMKDGKPVNDNGKPVPYAYIVQCSELKYFRNWYGHLQLVITAVVKEDKTEWRAFTPQYIYVFDSQDATPRRIKHNFGRTPVVLLKGATDSRSGFKVGMPRRWNLTGMYLAASELFYDLKKASMLFGHPIPAMSDEMVRQMSGAYDEETGKLDASKVKQDLGMIVTYPEGSPPNQLFYQADMSGLQHLRDVIFSDLINLIYQIAQVRDKSKVVHNASGRSKQFDSVEEQGLLGQTATDMENIEQQVADMMAQARGEEGVKVIYSKHHDLSSADEIWTQFIEGLQYGGVPVEIKRYQAMEYLRKKSAPMTIRQLLANELTTIGFPLNKNDIDALKDNIDGLLLAVRARPELVSDTTYEQLKQQLEEVVQASLTSDNQTD